MTVATGTSMCEPSKPGSSVGTAAVDKYTGIAPRHGKIQIQFMHNGKRIRETIHREPTPANLRRAFALREQILEEIRNRTFDLAYHFPYSASLKGATSGGTPVAYYIERHFELGDLTKSTAVDYRRKADRYLLPAFGETSVEDMTIIAVMEFRKSLLQTLARKSVNNIVGILSKALDLAAADGVIATNPIADLKSLKINRVSQADPFTFEELATLRAACYRPDLLNLIDVWWTTGLRTGELIGLNWKDIDLEHNQIHIHQARVLGEIKPTKTSQERYVPIYSVTHEALKRQRAITGDAEHGFIFEQPVAKSPYPDAAPLSVFFGRLYKRSGVRAREPYQFRHSYASYQLSAGERPYDVQYRMGHSTFRTIERHYKRWMHRNNQDWRTFEDLILTVRCQFD